MENPNTTVTCKYVFFLTDNTVPMLGHSICLQYRPHYSHPGDETQRFRSRKKKLRFIHVLVQNINLIFHLTTFDPCVVFN